MDWKGISKRKNKFPKPSIWPGRLKISFHKKSHIVISYIKNHTTRSHVIRFASFLQIWTRHKYAAAGTVFVFCAALMYSAIPDHHTAGNKEPGIGGAFGEDNHDHSQESQDEELKENLLKMEQDVNLDDMQTLSKREYIVKSGDTLSEIAKKFNVSVESIAGSSDIQLLDHLRIGQKLYIPNKEGFFYSVQKNERLAQVLKKYDVEYGKFLEENPNINPDLLEAGQEVFLPGAKPQNLVRSWLIPVGSRVVTSSYGWRRYPRHAFHKGLDLKAHYTSVRAAKGGRVIFAGRLGGYGNVVIIAHPGGYKTLYAHLSKIYVKKGSRVVQGTVIARSGNTGYSTGPHLHFEVTKNGRHINPNRVLTGLRYRRSKR